MLHLNHLKINPDCLHDFKRFFSPALTFPMPFLSTFSLREKNQAFGNLYNAINAAREAYHGPH